MGRGGYASSGARECRRVGRLKQRKLGKSPGRSRRGMDPLAVEQATTSAGDHPGVTAEAGRRCRLFGCPEVAAWIVSDPQGGEPSACEAELDVLFNEGLAECPWTAPCGWRSDVHEVLRTADGSASARSAYQCADGCHDRPLPLGHERFANLGRRHDDYGAPGLPVRVGSHPPQASQPRVAHRCGAVRLQLGLSP
jgi:hypothetical protein